MSKFEFLSDGWLSTRDTPATTDVGGSRLIRTSALPVPRANSKRDIGRLIPWHMVNFDKLKYDLEWADIPAAHAKEVLRLASRVKRPNSIGGAIFAESSKDERLSRYNTRYNVSDRNSNGVVALYPMEIAAWFDYTQEDVRRLVDAMLWLGEKNFLIHFDPSTLRFNIDQEALYESLCEAGEPVTRHEMMILNQFTVGDSDPREVAYAMAYKMPYDTLSRVLRLGMKELRKSLPKNSRYALLWTSGMFLFEDNSTKNDLFRGHIVFDIAKHVSYADFERFASTEEGLKVLNSRTPVDLIISSIQNDIDLDFINVMNEAEGSAA